MPRIHSKIKHSRTALLTALHRAIGNKEFGGRKFGSDRLAEAFLPFYARLLIKSHKIRTKIKHKDKTKMPGVFEYVLARTAFFDDVFTRALNENIPQIVILGAGYDSRAYRFADLNRSSRIIELDNEATQSRKMNCLKKSKIEMHEQVTIAPIDFNKESLKDVLQRAGYEGGEKALFIWEGVCMYLEPKSVDGILEFAAHSSHRESMIAFDYAITFSDNSSQDYYGAEEIRKIMEQHHPNEIFKFTIDEHKIEPYLGQRGLKLVKHFDHKQVDESFLSERNELPLGRPNGMFRFAIASPDQNSLRGASR